MNNNPLVSILINNYNYEPFLKQAIDSALNQAYSSIEVIVVDDGSIDNSREVISRYGDKIIPVLKENGGQASAFNAGFAASRGEIICFLDSDDLFLPEKVTDVVHAFGDREDVGWCFHPLKLVDKTLADINNQKSFINGNTENSFRQYDLTAQLKQGKADKNFPYTSTSGLCFKRSLLKQILPMPEAKGISLNDGYLTFTALALSKGVVLHKQLGLYRIHTSNAHAMRSDKRRVTARVTLLTAYWMRIKFPFLSKIANSLMATAIGIYIRNGGIDSELDKLVKNYLSSVTLWERLEIYTKAFYNSIKNPNY
ncbi:MAG TPA: glycosyltransferase [Coleofasciculaceae cyanobacterium]